MDQSRSQGGVGTRVKTVWPLGEWGGHDPDYKHKGLRDGEEILEYEGTGLPSPTRKNSCLGYVGIWTVGAWPLNSPAIVNFLLLHFSHLQFFFFPTFTF